MAKLAKNQRDYFLGIDGEQKGPFTKEQVSQMLEGGEVNIETQVWFEGMSDWQSLGSIKEFKSAEPQIKKVFTQDEQPSPNFELSAKLKNTAKDPEQVREVFQEPKQDDRDDFEPIFSSSDSHVSTEKQGGGGLKLGLVLGVLVAVGGAYYFWQQDQLKLQGVGVKPKQKISQSQARRLELSALQVEFNKNPEAVISKMIAIIKANPSDNTGLEALEVVSSYYRQKQLYSEVGEVLLVAQRPLEALELFKKDPPNYPGIERAYEDAVAKAKGNEKRELLLNQIGILITNLGKLDKAVEKIRLLEGEFPGTQHPYQYYLKSTEKKIADLFSRISFHFSDSLNSFINAELNYIQFLNKPLIQVTKDKSGKYRIVGTSKGPVNLRNDRLPNTFFVFWLWNDQWVIVDTNITSERAKFAHEEQKKHTNEVLSDIELLSNLETIFKTKFSGKAVHEAVYLPKRSVAESVE